MGALSGILTYRITLNEAGNRIGKEGSGLLAHNAKYSATQEA